MKEFFKWLGVNDKIAKLIIWVFTIMIFLIVLNAFLDSLGFDYYKITTENFARFGEYKILDILANVLVAILNFCSIVFLVFSIKDWKKSLKHIIIYVIMNSIINAFFGYAILQAFIILYFISYFYIKSGYNWKYIIYCLISITVNILMQYILYLYKGSMINFADISGVERLMLSADYFIIMIVFIICKEIYLRRRRSSICSEEDQVAYFGSESSTKKKASPKKSPKN